jgi:hypothetical protein
MDGANRIPPVSSPKIKDRIVTRSLLVRPDRCTLFQSALGPLLYSKALVAYGLNLTRSGDVWSFSGRVANLMYGKEFCGSDARLWLQSAGEDRMDYKRTLQRGYELTIILHQQKGKESKNIGSAKINDDGSFQMSFAQEVRRYQDFSLSVILQGQTSAGSYVESDLFTVE